MLRTSSGGGTFSPPYAARAMASGSEQHRLQDEIMDGAVAQLAAQQHAGRIPRRRGCVAFGSRFFLFLMAIIIIITFVG